MKRLFYSMVLFMCTNAVFAQSGAIYFKTVTNAVDMVSLTEKRPNQVMRANILYQNDTLKIKLNDEIEFANEHIVLTPCGQLEYCGANKTASVYVNSAQRVIYFYPHASDLSAFRFYINNGEIVKDKVVEGEKKKKKRKKNKN